jgi:hypothetical protein
VGEQRFLELMLIGPIAAALFAMVLVTALPDASQLEMTRLLVLPPTRLSRTRGLENCVSLVARSGWDHAGSTGRTIE